MFETLTDRLNNAFAKLGNKGKLTEADVDEVMREVRRALLEADVNFKVVREFVAAVRERAVGGEDCVDATQPFAPLDVLADGGLPEAAAAVAPATDLLRRLSLIHI